ncbi:MAG: hypothetical protein KJO20_09820, partial [Eudoraea sp.]|nr:hypothetical protein [Eudoraea sp.]
MKSINLRNLLLFVFVISWIGVLPQLLIAYGYKIPAFLGNLEILMTLGPILGAIIFIYKAHGKAGLKSFFSRLFRFKAPFYVILFVIFFPVILSLLSALIGLRLSDMPWPETFSASSIIGNGVLIFLVYLFINTEELVWRGIVF